MPLEDYKNLVGTAAGIATVGQMFSGVFMCKDIIIEGSTKEMSVVPFLGGTAISVLMYRYSDILNDPTILWVNIIGFLLNVSYLLCFYFYCNDKSDLHSKMFKAATFTGLLVYYSYWEDPDQIEFRFNVIMTVLMMVLIGSPLFSLQEIIKTKSTATLPFPLILSGTVVTFLWLLYGIIIKNSFIQFQNVVGFTLSFIQLSLFAIYPSKPKEVKKE